MSDATWRVQVSPKLADGTLINIRAESNAELEGLLDSFPVAKAAALTATLVAGANAAPLAAPTAQQPTTSTYQPSQPAAAPAPAGQSCVHGAMTYREAKQFVTKNGQQVPKWKGYFCPTPKGTAGQCEPQFIND